ncbi:MAG: DNA/RNA non-specific endonuclease [Prevotella sp.]|nr:DNA/RNA non-specific endonuclease [Prevotella sp.]
MQPQNHNLNAGIWEAMENQIRTWNKSSFRDTLYIVKG